MPLQVGRGHRFFMRPRYENEGRPEFQEAVKTC